MIRSQTSVPPNPFSTHRVRPGQLAYRFGERTELDLSSLVAKLRASRWIGQIVGPHGTGKSTLLKTLEPCWRDHERTPIVFALHNGQRSLPKFDWSSCNVNSQVVVDGYEQLGMMQRIRLRARCYVKGFGLLVTTHQPVSLAIPVIHRTSASRELARTLARELGGHQLADKLIDDCFVRANGDVRETFMLLYDSFERSRH